MDTLHLAFLLGTRVPQKHDRLYYKAVRVDAGLPEETGAFKGMKKTVSKTLFKTGSKAKASSAALKDPKRNN